MLRGNMDAIFKQIQTALLEKETTIYEKKCILYGINGSLDIAEERVMNLTM